ncbi:MAG TPA: helix-turn-helix domain-containing protein [Phycisphaerae bacterium]|nr:helix-turn-helix domain-containing protein [Phycisphaerae bacterium]
MRTAITISLNRTERSTLTRWSDAGGRLAQRARIVLLAADGLNNKQIAGELGTDEQTVGRWRARFASGRLDGIANEAPRSGRRPRVRERLTEKILRMTRRRAGRGTPWSTRTLAEALGVNHMLVYRVWQDHGLGADTA